jgi:ATP-binding cassette subfamily D (ALD) protein 4
MINTLHPDKQNLDNPDQRITADVDLLTNNYGSIIADIVIAPFTIAYYTYSAFSRAGWIGPTSM